MNEYVVTINEKKIKVNFSNNSKAFINGKEYDYKLSRLNNNTYNISLDNKTFLITARRSNSSEYSITLNGKVIETRVLTALQERAANLIELKADKHSTTIIKSPMPGMILKVKKQKGDSVERGDSLIILEAMKMENDIRSPVSGTIKEVKVSEGQAVEKGVSLLIIE